MIDIKDSKEIIPLAVNLSDRLGVRMNVMRDSIYVVIFKILVRMLDKIEKMEEKK